MTGLFDGTYHGGRMSSEDIADDNPATEILEWKRRAEALEKLATLVRSEAEIKMEMSRTGYYVINRPYRWTTYKPTFVEAIEAIPEDA